MTEQDSAVLDEPDGAALAALPGPMRRLIAALDAGIGPKAIYLFGSRATGRAAAGSDLDLILVMPGHQVGIDSRKEAEAIAAGTPVGADILLVSESQFATRGQTPLSFLGSIRPKRLR